MLVRSSIQYATINSNRALELTLSTQSNMHKVALAAMNLNAELCLSYKASPQWIPLSSENT